MHRFNPDHKHKLDNPWRREVLPPKETLEKYNISKHANIADIGAGTGYFTNELIHITDGAIYALDISEDMLNHLEEHKVSERIQTIQTKEDHLILPDKSVDVVLMVNVLHEVPNMDEFMNELNRILTDDGKLIIIEWAKKEMQHGPRVDHRLSVDEIKTHASLILTEFEVVDVSDYFDSVVASKKKRL